MCKAGGVEAGQPHVADDHQPERVVGVLEPLGQGLAAGFVADVLLPFELVRRRAGHDDLDRPPVVVFLVPLRAELDDLVVQVDADPPAHADDHALTVDRGESLLEVVDQVLGHELDPLLGPDQRLQACPLALELLLLVQLLALGDLLEVLVELRPLGLVEFDLGQPAFIVDPDGGPILDGPLDIVDVDVVAEDGLGVLVGQLDGRACEANERSVGQGISHVAGKAVDEVVLTPMGLVGHDNDVAAVGEPGILAALRLGQELLDRGEDHAAGGDLEQLLDLVAVLGLGG